MSEDVELLWCTRCQSDLRMTTDALVCQTCQARFPIHNGIPRFVESGQAYNASWDFKWKVLDNGKGYNYEMLDPKSNAYQIHNVMRHFDGETALFQDLGEGIAVDVGCGLGQYSVALLQKGLRRVYAVDLTRGVDVGQQLIRERYPQLADRIVFIQANARCLPIKTGRADLAMALASIQFSGFLDDCVGEVSRITKPGHRFFIWVYEKPLIQISDRSRTFTGWIKLTGQLLHYSYIELLLNLFRRMPESIRLPLLKLLATDTVYGLRRIPLAGRFFRYFTFGVCDHPDKGYRLINLYDYYSPAYAEASDESDAVRWSKQFGFKILAYCPWRLGFIGQK